MKPKQVSIEYTFRTPDAGAPADAPMVVDMGVGSPDHPIVSGLTISRAALIDETGAFRYFLSRTWDKNGSRVCWIMLNPSTADAFKDDPTIFACIDFAKRWGHGGIDVVNLFAFRTSSPAVLRKEAKRRDVVGLANDAHILRIALNAKTVIAAWGRSGTAVIGGKRRDDFVLRLLSNNRVLVCALKVLPGDIPGHPLARGNHRISRLAEPIPFKLPIGAGPKAQAKAVVP